MLITISSFCTKEYIFQLSHQPIIELKDVHLKILWNGGVDHKVAMYQNMKAILVFHSYLDDPNSKTKSNFFDKYTESKPTKIKL